ncbi:lipid kinase [Alsobacter sp. R-9]
MSTLAEHQTPMTGAAARRRALMLVNPNARQGKTPLDRILERLGAGGIDAAVETFATPDELAADIARRRADMDLVIVCGGDGTINAAARAVMESGLPMGIMPMGTANDLARTLGLPMTLTDAAGVIAAGHTRRIDIGEVNGHPFFNVASIGLSAELAQTLSPDIKRRWGRLGYAIAAAKVLARAEPFSATITSRSGEDRVKTLQIAVGNGRHYGGGNVVEHTAEIDDAHLDLYSLELANVWKLALMLRSFRQGQHGAWKEVRTARCTEFEIRTRRPRPINTDGELVTETPARFVVRPGAIEVFAPPKGSVPSPAA